MIKQVSSKYLKKDVILKDINLTICTYYLRNTSFIYVIPVDFLKDSSFSIR